MFYAVPIGGTDVPLIVMWSAVAALFFTVYLRFINVRALGLAIRHAKGDFSDPTARGEISHFKAVATAVSGTVGVGNIGGVAVAITVGGPGAAFWLFIAGLLSMSTKLVECTLGVKYRRYNADGSVSGGPMFYMEAYFRERGWPTLGKGFGAFYAAALVVGCLGIGNMFQSNQAFAQVLVITGGTESIFADRGWVFGLLLAGVIAAVIIGGIQSIATGRCSAGPGDGAPVSHQCVSRHRPQRRAYPRRSVVGGLRGLHRAGGLWRSCWAPWSLDSSVRFFPTRPVLALHRLRTLP